METPVDVSASKAAVTSEERAYVIQLLQDSHKQFLAGIVEVNAAQWTWKPGPEQWSVGETFEHVMLAEAALFRGVKRAIEAPANCDWEVQTAEKTEMLKCLLPDRGGKASSPESIRPQGLSKDAVMRRFDDLRMQTLRFAVETGISLKEHTADHPFPIFKTLNAYQWLLYIPLHTKRHLQQIQEIQRTFGYPQ